MPTESKIANPFAEESAFASAGHVPEGLDAAWEQEKVNFAAAEEVQKRNGAPAGTYVTNPSEFPAIINTGKAEEKDKVGNVIGSRLVASVVVRGTAKIQGHEEPVVQILRFRLSPETRPAKIYDEARNWTGEYNQTKDDLPTRLWANAVSGFKEMYGPGNYAAPDILRYLGDVPVAIQCMQGSNGDLVPLKIQNRGRRSRAH